MKLSIIHKIPNKNITETARQSRKKGPADFWQAHGDFL